MSHGQESEEFLRSRPGQDEVFKHIIIADPIGWNSCGTWPVIKVTAIGFHICFEKTLMEMIMSSLEASTANVFQMGTQLVRKLQ